MPDIEQFNRWAQRAEGEKAPEPDVVHAVMRRIREGRRDPLPGPGALPWVMSGAMAAAAAVCAVLGAQAWMAASDPVAAWVRQVAEWGML